MKDAAGESGIKKDMEDGKKDNDWIPVEGEITESKWSIQCYTVG